MAQRPQKLANFLEDFLDKHTAEGEPILLEITAEEVQDLGLFFIQGFCGYLLRTRQAEAMSMQAPAEEEPGDTGNDEEESDEEIHYIH